MESHYNGKPTKLITQHLEQSNQNDLINEYTAGLEGLRLSKTPVVFSTTYFDILTQKHRAIIVYLNTKS